MADVQKTVAIIFSGRDEVSRTMRQIGASMDTFGAGINAAAAPLASIGDSVLAVDRALAALAAGGMAYATYQSALFEESAVNLSKIVSDELQPQIPGLTDSMIEMGNQFGVAGNVAVDSATDFVRAGFDLQSAGEMAEFAARFVLGASEAEFQLAEATELTIAALRGFNVPMSEAAQEAEHLGNVINITANNFATNVTELTQGMALFAPLAGQMNMSFEETASVLTPVIEVMRSGSEAANAMRTIYLRLTSSVEPVQRGLRMLGVSQTDANGEMRNAADIMRDVQAAYQNVSQPQQAVITNLVAGKNRAIAFNISMQQMDRQAQILARTSLPDVATSLDREVAAKLATTTAAVNRFIAGFQNLSIIIGNQFREAVGTTISSAAEIENALQTAISAGAFEPIFAAFRDFNTRLSGNLQTIARNIPEAFEGLDFSGLLDALENLGDELGLMFDGVDLSTPEGLQDAVQGLIDTFTGLINITTGIYTAWRPYYEAIAQAISDTSEMNSETQQAFGQILGSAQMIVQMGVTVAGVFAAIRTSGSDMAQGFDIIVGTTQVVVNGIHILVDSMLMLFSGITEAVLFVAESAARLGGIFSDSSEQIARDIESTRNEFRLFRETVGDDQVQQFEDLASGMSRFSGEAREAGQAIANVGTQAESTTDSLRDTAREEIIIPFDADVTGLMNAAQTAQAQLQPLTDPVQVQMSLDTNELERSARIAQTQINQVGEQITEDLAGVGEINASVDMESFYSASGVVRETLPDGTVVLTGEFDDRSFRRAAGEAEAEVAPLAERLRGNLELELKLETAQAQNRIDEMEIKADILRDQMRYEAELDMARFNASAEQSLAIIENLGSSVTSTNSLVGDLFGAAAQPLDYRFRSDLERAIDQSMERAQELHDLQVRQTEQQMRTAEAQQRFYDERAAAIRRGEGTINVTADASLAPDLESILLAIIERAQVNASNGLLIGV